LRVVPFLLGERMEEKTKRDPKDNLISFADMPKDKHHEISVKGGKHAAAVREARKSSAEITQQLLNANASKLAHAVLNDEDFANYSKLVKDGDLGGSMGDLLAYRMLVQACAGDTKAATYTRDTAGDKPVDKTDIRADIVSDADRALIGKLVARETINATQINQFPEIRLGEPKEEKAGEEDKEKEA
jgi:hypothetical protein